MVSSDAHSLVNCSNRRAITIILIIEPEAESVYCRYRGWISRGHRGIQQVKVGKCNEI